MDRMALMVVNADMSMLLSSVFKYIGSERATFGIR